MTDDQVTEWQQQVRWWQMTAGLVVRVQYEVEPPHTQAKGPSFSPNLCIKRYHSPPYLLQWLLFLFPYRLIVAGPPVRSMTSGSPVKLITSTSLTGGLLVQSGSPIGTRRPWNLVRVWALLMLLLSTNQFTCLSHSASVASSAFTLTAKEVDGRPMSGMLQKFCSFHPISLIFLTYVLLSYFVCLHCANIHINWPSFSFLMT